MERSYYLRKKKTYLWGIVGTKRGIAKGKWDAYQMAIATGCSKGLVSTNDKGEIIYLPNITHIEDIQE